MKWARNVVRNLVAGAACALVMAMATAGEKSQADLSPAAAWKLDLQGGAKGELTVAKAAGAEGKDGLTVTADLSGEAAKNGTFAAITRKFDDLAATSIDAITFNLKSANVTKATLRIVDSTGQVFQRRPGLTADGQPHSVTVEVASWTKSEHFGGANDGVIHQPLKSIAISFPKGCAADGKPVATISDISAIITK